MKKLLSLSLAVVAIAAMATTPVSAQVKDPVMGTWMLNVAKSSYSPGPAPKSGTRTYSTSGKMFKAVYEAVAADGKPIRSEYTAAYDGKDYPITGSPNADMIAHTRTDANTVDAVLKKAGKETSRTHRVLSADGKTLTMTTTGIGPKGESIRNVLVFDRK